MSGDPATTMLSAIAALAMVTGLSAPDQAVAASVPRQPGGEWTPDPVTIQVATSINRPIRLVDRVVAGSDFDEFRAQLWQAIQRRDILFMQNLLPPEGIFIGQEGPISPDMLALSDVNSSFWHSLEKMLAPQSCELEDYPGKLPDSAVWGCPNIASALFPPPVASDTSMANAHRNQVVVVGRRVNVRSRPRLGTAVVGRLSNEVVEFDWATWQELMQTSPETTDNPINGWTPVILPNDIQGYVYNRYVYHPQGPRALFEHVDGRWQLMGIVVDEDEDTTPSYP